MKCSILLLILLGLFLAGCSASTPPSSTTGIKIISSGNIATIAVGGFTFPAHDSSHTVALPLGRRVNFDFLPEVSIRNDSNVRLSVNFHWTFGIMKSMGGRDTFISDIVGLPLPSMTLGGPIAPGESQKLGFISSEINPITQQPMSYSSVDERLTHQQLAYRLIVGTQTDTSLFVLTGILDSTIFEKRYRGFIYTTETSPDPLGEVDLPLDQDLSGSSSFHALDVYPNPVPYSTQLTFEAKVHLDSVKANLYFTPNHSILEFLIIDIAPGSHTVMMDVSSIPMGLYRLEIFAWQGNSTTFSHENVCVRGH